MRLEFRVDWGYQFLYSRRHYHPLMRWDGRIECERGEVLSLRLLKYPVNWFGPCQSPAEVALAGDCWESSTRRGLEGIRVVAECADSGARFTLTTPQGVFSFTAGEVLANGRIVFPVGWKYSHCTVIVTRKGAIWFRPAPLPGEVVVESSAFPGAEMVEWARMECAWMDPGCLVEFDVDLPQPAGDGGEACWLAHLQAMTAGVRAFPETQGKDYIPMEIREGGRILAAFRYYLRWHDPGVQMLQDIWAEIPIQLLPPGRHRLRIVNTHTGLPLLLNRVSFRAKTRRHLDLTVPRWALTGREFIAGVRVTEPGAEIRFQFDPRVLRQLGSPVPGFDGFQDYRFVADTPACDVRIGVTDARTGKRAEAVIETIHDLPAESPVLKVGYDMTTVPHDDTGEMDWLLDYTHRTQLGNLVCFRPFTPLPVATELYGRWGRFCRDHGIFVQGICPEADGLIGASGDQFHALGAHELSGTTYAWDPDNESRTMREATERFTAFMRGHVDATRRNGAPAVAFGDASGAHRHSLIAGADFVRAETMVQHTQQHLSQARAAAQALGTGEWGVHIAIQHPKQPYLDSHLDQYRLSLYQAWMMGASFLYEEDSLFLMFKEERMCWDDALTKGKRDITREFWRWAATHPRTGAPDISICHLLGRYAPPFSGFICGSEQDPSYSVWGKFGRSERAWGHLQPEKGQQILDALMPGASTHPLRQRYDRRRFFFSPTPHGDFDQAPIEATAAFLSRYRLALMLCWHTMTAEDHAKLREYADQGGTLLLAVPHLSTHEDRSFLERMNDDDLALWNGGDATELCGVKVRGRGARYCGHWTATGAEFGGAKCPEMSRVPSVSPDEDGPCHLAAVDLCGAEPVIVDAISLQPMLVRHRLGRGLVYTMTTWAYPGHEELADFAGAVMENLAARCDDQAPASSGRVTGGEFFWNRWREASECTRFMLLGTDWAEPDQPRMATIHTARHKSAVVVPRACQPVLAVCFPFGGIAPADPDPHIEVVRVDADSAHLRVHARPGVHGFRLLPDDGRLSLRIHGKPVRLASGTPSSPSFVSEWSGTTVQDWVLESR